MTTMIGTSSINASQVQVHVSYSISGSNPVASFQFQYVGSFMGNYVM